MKSKIMFILFILTLSTFANAQSIPEQFSVECKTSESDEASFTKMNFNYNEATGVLTETRKSDALYEMIYQGESLKHSSIADYSVTQAEKGVILKLLIVTGDPSKRPIILRIEKEKSQSVAFGTISYGVFEQNGVLEHPHIRCSFFPK